jgi:hypothetical protein
MPYTPTNLDGISEDELHQLTHVYSALKAYAKAKGDAMMARQTGFINAARAHEEHCERIYSELPPWAQ